jgi:hypothetical protein
MFFAFAAVACLGHRFQTSLRDRLLADLTHPVGTMRPYRRRSFCTNEFFDSP